MHCGFAMISVGCVRAKFAKHIAMLVLVDGCASGIAWYLFGCALSPKPVSSLDRRSANVYGCAMESPIM